MTSFFNRYATPFITGLFLVSLISGLALFFHIGPSGFHAIHEWLSLVLIIPFVLHICKNWRPMVSYLRHAPMAITLALSFVAAAVFLWPTRGEAERRGGPPQFALAERIMTAPLEDVAPVLGLTPQALTARISAADYTITPGQSLSDISAATGKDKMQMIGLLTGN